MFVRSLICAIAVVAVALVAAPAGAQEQPDFDAARRHYLAGKDAHGKADYERAINEYILAYDITKDPSLFKQIAVSYEASGKKTEAVVYYRRYLAEAKAGADADEVKAKVASLEGSAAPPAAAATTQPAAVEPSLDEPPPLPPEPPPSATPAIEPMTVPSPSMMDQGGGSWQRTTGWVSVGLAAIALTTGSVLATSALSREEDLQRLIDFRDPVTMLPREYAGTVKEDYLDKRDEGEKLSKYATVAFIGAGAFTGAAILFFILDATRDTEEPAPAARILPSIGPDSVGVTLGWSL